jgi:xylulokinase
VGIRPVSILGTGGASRDMALIRVMADVFGVPVLTGDRANSAALGAAYRALHGWTCAGQGRFLSFADVLKETAPFKKAAEPDPRAHAVYSAMLLRYAELERRVVAG